MAKKVLVSLNLSGNEIQNALVHVLATAPTALGAGQVYYDSVENRVRWYDGAQWNSLYTINDAGTSTTDLWSANQIQSAINTAVSGGVTYQGGYDAAVDTPDLDTTTPATGVLKGYMYTVTAAGTFFTEQVSIGDVLISEIDSPATLADWTIVERNLNSATETSEGTTEIATQAEVDAGTDDFRYVTPLKLTTWKANSNTPTKFSVDLDSAEATVARVFAGGNTTFTITHSLNTTDTVQSIKEISTGEEIIADVDNTGANTMEVIFNGNKADGIYRVTIIG